MDIYTGWINEGNKKTKHNWGDNQGEPMNKGIQKLAQETEQNYNMQVQTNRKQETQVLARKTLNVGLIKSCWTF